MSNRALRAKGWIGAFGAAAALAGALLDTWVSGVVAEVVALVVFAIGAVVAFKSYFFEQSRHRAEKTPEQPQRDPS